MGNLKRLEVKYVRDKAKSLYRKKDVCEACGATEELQLHHRYSIDELWTRFKRKRKIVKELTMEEVLTLREEFIAEHQMELYEHVLTLCKVCHNEKLHKMFGQTPSLATAQAQLKWLNKQRELNGL